MSWARHEKARELSSLSPESILRLLIESEAAAAALPASDVKKIARLTEEISQRIAHGGVLRIASEGSVAHLVAFAEEEMSVWFPGLVPMGIMTAPADASEEDAVALVEASVLPDDVVLGVSRSGARPWTCMVMRKANMIGALTTSISCVPDNPMSRECDLPIIVACGPEVVMGCSQYGAATVVKVVLDAILLGLAAKAGGLYGGVPIRADAGADSWRLVAAAAEVDHLRARSLVAAADGEIAVAVVMGRLDVDADEARRRLEESGGRLADAVGGSRAKD